MVGTKLINLGNLWTSRSNWIIPLEGTRYTIRNSDRDRVLGVENNGNEAGTRVIEEIHKHNDEGQYWLRKGSYFQHSPSGKYLCAEAAHKLIIDGN